MIVVSGKRLKELRKKKGISVEEIAKLTNSSVSSVRRWEENDSLSDIDTFFVLKNFYGVEWEDLLLQDGEQMEKREEIAKPCASRLLDRTDILLLLSMVGCVLLFVGLFVFAVSARDFSHCQVWEWYFYPEMEYIPFHVFRLFVIGSIIGFILSLNEYVKRGKNK